MPSATAKFPKKILRALAELKNEDDPVQVDLMLAKAQKAILVKWLRACLKRDGVDVRGTVTSNEPFLTIHTGAAAEE